MISIGKKIKIKFSLDVDKIIDENFFTKIRENGYQITSKYQNVMIKPRYPQKLLSGGALVLVREIKIKCYEKKIEAEIEYSLNIILLFYLMFLFLGALAQINFPTLLFIPILTSILLLIMIGASFSEIKNDFKRSI